MNLTGLFRCVALVSAILLGSQARGQSSYTMYYQSGPPPTTQASSSSMGFEVPIERTGHSFSFCWRIVASGSASNSSTYPARFVTSSDPLTP